MAIIPQKQLFGWQEIDELGDLERLCLALGRVKQKQKERMRSLVKAG